jgi:hypothetical protein
MLLVLEIAFNSTYKISVEYINQAVVSTIHHDLEFITEHSLLCGAGYISQFKVVP